VRWEKGFCMVQGYYGGSRLHRHCSTPTKTSFNASVNPGNTRDAIAPPSPIRSPRTFVA
jgi:hypothetical protein